MSARDDLVWVIADALAADDPEASCAHNLAPVADAILVDGWVPQEQVEVTRHARDCYDRRAQALAAQVQRVRDRCAFWADAGDAEADIATDILTAIINDGEGADDERG